MKTQKIKKLQFHLKSKSLHQEVKNLLHSTIEVTIKDHKQRKHKDIIHHLIIIIGDPILSILHIQEIEKKTEIYLLTKE